MFWSSVRRSTSAQLIPRKPRSTANATPTGPPPTITNWKFVVSRLMTAPASCFCRDGAGPSSGRTARSGGGDAPAFPGGPPKYLEIEISMGRLEGKVAIVFGAGPNLGGTIAYFMAREGADIAVCDLDEAAARDTAAFIASRGGRAIALRGDATNEDDVAAAVARTVERFGTIDIEKWKTALLSFPTAGMLTTKHCAKAMIAGGKGGSIIHLLSTAAHFGEASGAAYTAAKGALLNFARSAAMDLAHDRIRVNTITPCAMEHQLWTNMRDEVFDPSFVRPNTRSFYSRDDYLKMIPLERFPRAADVAWAAVFLASDEASFVTGIDLPVDGGLRVKYPAWRPGDHTGVNIADYVDAVERTAYGESVGKLRERERK